MKEVTRNPSSGPSYVAEPPLALAGHSAPSNATQLRGKSTLLTHVTEPPSSPKVFHKGNTSRSQSRGRSKARSRSTRHAQYAGPNTQSTPGSQPDGPTNGVGQIPKRTQGHRSSAPGPITWANVAKVLTKGYNLAYVPPLVVDGEVIVDITPDVAADENPIWLECIVGHYIGKKIPFKLTEEAVKKSWGDQIIDVKLHETGFYFFRVPDAEFRKKIVDMGPISIFSSTMMLQQWHSKLKLKKGTLDSLPVWVRLRDIPFSLWSPVGIGRKASAIGKPLYVDVQIEQMTRISYARVCVEIKASDPRCEAVKIRWDDEVSLINIEYEWKPLACTACGIFGHKLGSKGFDCAAAHKVNRKTPPVILNQMMAGRRSLGKRVNLPQLFLTVRPILL